MTTESSRAAEQFLTDECTPHVRDLLRSALDAAAAEPKADRPIEENSFDEETRAIDDPREPETTVSNPVMGQSWGNQDAVEAALAKAIEGATAAGRFDVVALLAGELRARRLAREGVATRDAKKRRVDA